MGTPKTQNPNAQRPITPPPFGEKGREERSPPSSREPPVMEAAIFGKSWLGPGGHPAKPWEISAPWARGFFPGQELLLRKKFPPPQKGNSPKLTFKGKSQKWERG
ncbi:hypothetical protein JTB14_028469 [Gonioctena quinquepunctata]|nr:hypothetical protein JTB14_028469 [Gonioctena quinquepunctata]